MLDWFIFDILPIDDANPIEGNFKYMIKFASTSFTLATLGK